MPQRRAPRGLQRAIEGLELLTPLPGHKTAPGGFVASRAAARQAELLDLELRQAELLDLELRQAELLDLELRQAELLGLELRQAASMSEPGVRR